MTHPQTEQTEPVIALGIWGNTGDRARLERTLRDDSPGLNTVLIALRSDDPVPETKNTAAVQRITVGDPGSGLAVLALVEATTAPYLLLMRAGDRILPGAIGDIHALLSRSQTGNQVIAGGFILAGTDALYPATVLELSAYGDGVSRELFVSADIDRPFALPLSGTVLPADVLKSARRFVASFADTRRRGSAFLSAPGVGRILQPAKPLVECSEGDSFIMSWEPGGSTGSEGAYCLAQALYTVDPALRKRLVSEGLLMMLAERNVRDAVALGGSMVQSLTWSGRKQYGSVGKLTWRVMTSVVREHLPWRRS